VTNRTAILAAVGAGVLSLMAGCGGAGSAGTGVAGPVRAGGLLLSLDLPSQAATGQQVRAALTVRNDSLWTQRIVAPTGAPVVVRVYRRGEFGWELFARYPQFAAAVLTPWSLKPRQERVFPLPLTVGPDWPVSQPLRLVVELNGRPAAQVERMMTVVPAVAPKP
jgi:hypothetical protein